MSFIRIKWDIEVMITFHPSGKYYSTIVWHISQYHLSQSGSSSLDLIWQAKKESREAASASPDGWFRVVWAENSNVGTRGGHGVWVGTSSWLHGRTAYMEEWMGVESSRARAWSGNHYLSLKAILARVPNIFDPNFLWYMKKLDLIYPMILH